MKGLYDNTGLNTDRIEMTILISFIVLEMILLIVPIIMNSINIANLKDALPRIQSDKGAQTTVLIENGEYVFKNSRGKEISRKEYDDLSDEFNFTITSNYNRVSLGVAKEGNKVIIINTSGEEMFTLCNIFDNYEKVASNFRDYIVENNIVY